MKNSIVKSNSIELNLKYAEEVDFRKQAFDKLPFAEHLQLLSSELHELLFPLLKAHQQLIASLMKQPVDKDEVLHDLVTLEAQFLSTLKSKLFKQFPSESKLALNKVFFSVEEDAEGHDFSALINELINKKSVAILLKPTLDAIYSSALRSAINSLQITHFELNEVLMRHLPVLDLNQEFCVEVDLFEADEQFNEVNDFLSVLHQIKIKNPLEFDRCINLLSQELLLENQERFTLSQKTKLLTILNQVENESVADSLQNFFQLMKEYPDHSDEHLDDVLAQISFLVHHRKTLTSKAFQVVLYLSCLGNFSQNTLFPLKQLMQIKTLAEVTPEDSTALFLALNQLIERINAEQTATDKEAILRAVIIKTEALIENKKKTTPGLIPLVTLLINRCSSSHKEIQQYNALIDTLIHTDDAILTHWSKVLFLLGTNAPKPKGHLLLEAAWGLQAQKFNLERIMLLFNYPPYPALEKFAKVLRGSSKDLNEYIDSFDKDPKAQRQELRNHFGEVTKSTSKIIEEQFDTSQLEFTLEQIKLIEGTGLSDQERYELGQQVTYINAIGKSYPLFIKHLASDEITEYTDLTQLSRVQLRNLSDYLIESIRKPGFSALEKSKAQLNLMAVLREHYFRVSGNYPNTTHLITVLLSLKNQQHNMLMKIEDVENRPITTALLAAMQWVHADGGTVDVCLAHKEFATLDYCGEGIKDFFTSIGIESTLIDAHSSNGDYKVGGINYSTLGYLGSYRLNYLQGNAHLTGTNPKNVPTHLIFAAHDISSIEPLPDANLSVKKLLHGYRQSGRIIGLSETLNNPNKLLEQHGLFPKDAACEIPARGANRTELLTDSKTKNPEAYINAINDSLKAKNYEQPIIIIAQNEQEVKYLEMKLKEENPSYNIEIFTGDEAAQGFHKRIKNHAGKNDSITITTALMLHNTHFDTKNPKGFLTIQTFLDSTSQVFHQATKNYKQGQYSVLYEEDEVFVAKLWSYETKPDQEKIAENISLIHQRKLQMKYVERHYLQSVSGMIQVVMKQFDEWHAFLKLIYPKNMMIQLNRDLLLQKDNLVSLLEEQWQHCLKNSNPPHSNPYERLEIEGKLQTSGLDQALEQFEMDILKLWADQCVSFKERTRDKITKDSVDELRFNHMANVSIAAELQLSKLKAHDTEDSSHKKNKDSPSYVSSGLDISGAMLRYSDADSSTVEKYRHAFKENQFKLIKKKLAIIVGREPFFKSSRVSLLKKIETTESLENLAILLVDGDSQIFSDKFFAKKFVFQPIVQEILHLVKALGLQDTAALQDLKKEYLDNVLAEIIDDLEYSLSWVTPEQRGLGYLLERHAVISAATDLLDAVKKLKETADLNSRQAAVKNLYIVLTKHQAQLKGLWIFSFGHKNTRTLINETLATLNGLAIIGDHKDNMILDHHFIQECKEDAVSQVMLSQFDTAVNSLELKNKELINTFPDWKVIKNRLQSIQLECQNAYVFDEISYFLQQKIEEMTKTDSKFMFLLIQLRGEARKIHHEESLNNQDLKDNSRYLTLKAENISNKFNHLAGCAIQEVKIKAGHNGFSDYFDLVVEGQVEHPLFDDFIRYDAPSAELLKIEEITGELDTAKGLMQQIADYEFSLLGGSIDLINPPLCLQKQWRDILNLQAFMQEKAVLTDVTLFSTEIQSIVFDRDLIKDFAAKELNLNLINKLLDNQLKADLLQLHEKINPSTPVDLLNKMWSYTKDLIKAPKTLEDWKNELDLIKKTVITRLNAQLNSELEQKQSLLKESVKELSQQTARQIEILEEKKDFLINKDAGHVKVSLCGKRFNDITELYQFEEHLQKTLYESGYEDTHSASSTSNDEFVEVNDETSLSFTY